MVYDLWTRLQAGFTRDEDFHEYEITPTTISADGTLLKTRGEQDLDFSVWTTITLFGTVGGLHKILGYSSIKYFRIYNEYNLIMNLVPCLDENKIPCMYDYVSGKYFYNKGTGNFLIT